MSGVFTQVRVDPTQIDPLFQRKKRQREVYVYRTEKHEAIQSALKKNILKAIKYSTTKNKQKRTNKIATIIRKNKSKIPITFFLCGIMHMRCGSRNFTPGLYETEGYLRTCNLQR